MPSTERRSALRPDGRTKVASRLQPLEAIPTLFFFPPSSAQPLLRPERRRRNVATGGAQSPLGDRSATRGNVPLLTLSRRASGTLTLRAPLGQPPVRAYEDFWRISASWSDRLQLGIITYRRGQSIIGTCLAAKTTRPGFMLCEGSSWLAVASQWTPRQEVPRA